MCDARPNLSCRVLQARAQDMRQSTLAGSQPEIEFVLVVSSQDPMATVRDISGLVSVGNFEMRPGGHEKIHDVYFDTPEGALRRKKMTLRIREVNNEYFITLKQNPGLFSRKRDERQELQLPWSPDSFDRVFAEFERRGIRLDRAKGRASNPSEALRNVGLKILQDRETERQTRLVLHGNDIGPVLAELAIDSVTYHFDGRDIRLYELEIEAKSESGRAMLKDVRREILEEFSSELRPWKWGKLATGRAIERLLRAGNLEGFLNGDRLKGEAFAIIEDVMRGKSSGRA